MAKKVRVYFNLHKHCYSVQDTKTGRVIAHVESINLIDAKFVVRESGRQKVLREKRKNVHAFVVGIWEKSSCKKLKTKVRYNPYIRGEFFTDNGIAVVKADLVSLIPEGIFI